MYIYSNSKSPRCQQKHTEENTQAGMTMKKLIIAFIALFLIMAATPAIISLAAYIPVFSSATDDNISQIESKTHTDSKADKTTNASEASSSDEKVFVIKEGENSREITAKEAVAGTLAAIMPSDYNKESSKALAAAVYSTLMSKAGSSKAQIADSDPFLAADEAKEERGDKFYSRCEDYADFALNTKIEYNGKPVELLIFNSCAGATMNPSDILSSPLPCHQSVSSPWDMYSNISYEKSFTSSEVEKILKESFGADEAPEDIKNAIKIKSTAPNGTVLEAEVCGNPTDGIEIMNAFSLKSPCFTVGSDDGGIIFNVAGEGIPVGMSVIGADGMASQGAGWEEILSHYYCDIDISNNED